MIILIVLLLILYLKFFKDKIKKLRLKNKLKKQLLDENPEGRNKTKNKFKKILFGKTGSSGLIMKSIVYALLVIIGFIYLYPLLYMLVTSFKCDNDLMDTSIKWIPSMLDFQNYKTAFESLNLKVSFFKTLIVVGIPSLLNTIVAMFTAYGFSRFKFPGKKILFGLMLATFFIPAALTKIPQFVWYTKMNLIGSIMTYIIPSTFGQGLNEALFILILYSMFNQIPKQLEEAAKIDGASSLGVFFRVAVPLVIPGIITVFLFSFVWYWNDSATAAMYLGRAGKDNWATIPVMLERYQNEIISITNGGIGMQLYQGEKMSATLLSITPLLILYFFLQKFFVKSIENSGITGE